MEKIQSFKIDHSKLVPGFYISRRDGDVVTYDVRVFKPNTEYMSTAGAHTIEHIVATFLRNTLMKDHIIYFGPMGCRTGFYLLTRDLGDSTAWKLLRQAMRAVVAWSLEDSIPGATPEECGNAADHSLDNAKAIAMHYLRSTPEEYSMADLIYPQ